MRSSQVRHYNTQPPFNFPAIQLKKTVDIHVSIYAAHLYDSVVLYAKALDQIIKEEEKKLEEGIKAEEEKLETALAKIMGDDADASAAKERARKETSLKVDLMIRSGVNIAELARNGTRITNEIINMRGFQSISGSYIRIDANGDSEGNFTAFALKSHDYTLQSLFTGQKFHCDNYLMPVGEFHIGHDHFNMSVAQTPSGESTKPLPEYAILKKIDWPKGFKPLDMPVCGYREEECQGGEGVTELAAIILSILLVCAIIATLGVYRKWKIEQEIEGLLWKINAECLQGVGLQNSRTSKHSMGSLISGRHLVFPPAFCRRASFVVCNPVFLLLLEPLHAKGPDSQGMLMQQLVLRPARIMARIQGFLALLSIPLAHPCTIHPMPNKSISFVRRITGAWAIL